MPDHEWETFLGTVDEVAATPAEVSDRIWARIVDAAPVLGDDVDPAGGAPVAIDLPVDQPSTIRRRWPRAIAPVCAAAALIAAIVWVAGAGEPEPVPLAAPTNACSDLQRASNDLTLFTFDGPVLAAPQLDLLGPALEVFVEELAGAGASSDEELARWRDVTRQLRQAAVEIAVDPDAAAAGVATARLGLGDLVGASDDPLVTSCFSLWRE